MIRILKIPSPLGFLGVLRNLKNPVDANNFLVAGRRKIESHSSKILYCGLKLPRTEDENPTGLIYFLE